MTLKESLLAMGKWGVVMALLLVIGLLMATGLGRRRGSRAYRVRVALWQAVLVIAGGTALFGLTVGQQGCRELSHESTGQHSTCYVPILVPGEKKERTHTATKKGEPAALQPEVVGILEAETDESSTDIILIGAPLPEPPPMDGPVGKPHPDPMPENGLSGRPIAESLPKGARVGKPLRTPAPEDAPGVPEVQPSVPSPGPPNSDPVEDALSRAAANAKARFVPSTSVSCYITIEPEPDRSYRRLLGKQRSAFLKCYQHRVEELEVPPQGRLSLSLRIEENGKASVTVKQDTVGDPELAQCIVKKIQRLSFPKPEKPFVTTVPLVFKPSDKGAAEKPHD